VESDRRRADPTLAAGHNDNSRALARRSRHLLDFLPHQGSESICLIDHGYRSTD